jgi:hypothetical protein
MRFHRFPLLGIDYVGGEWKLVTMARNMKRIVALRHQAGLQSFRSMTGIEARRKNASALP